MEKEQVLVKLIIRINKISRHVKLTNECSTESKSISRNASYLQLKRTKCPYKIASCTCTFLVVNSHLPVFG